MRLDPTGEHADVRGHARAVLAPSRTMTGRIPACIVVHPSRRARYRKCLHNTFVYAGRGAARGAMRTSGDNSKEIRPAPRYITFGVPAVATSSAPSPPPVLRHLILSPRPSLSL